MKPPLVPGPLATLRRVVSSDMKWRGRRCSGGGLGCSRSSTCGLIEAEKGLFVGD